MCVRSGDNEALFYDTGLVKGDQGQRLENLVAVCLQKSLFYVEDRDGKRRSLDYLRTKEGKEVDFVTVERDGRAYGRGQSE